jgi:hypothetical protein
MTFTQNIKRYFLREPELYTVNVFRKALYVYLLFCFAQLWPDKEELFGENSIIIVSYTNGFSLRGCLNLLSQPAFADFYSWFLVGQALFCVLGLFHVYPRIAAIGVWFFTVNINNRTYLMNTGGEQLVNILLFYLMFMSPQKRKQENVALSILDNTFIMSCQLQVILVYLVSALFKILQPEWRDGSALFYVFAMDEFGGQFALSNLNPLILQILSYFSLAYQVLFPVLIFFRKIKKPVLICGVLMHLGIMFTVGLFNFSLVMIICYLLFLGGKNLKLQT